MGSTPQPVVVTGEVERPLTVRPHELERLAGDEATVDFHCHEGWTRPGQRYRGVRLARPLRLAEQRAAARFVTVASGGFSVLLTREQAEDDRVLLATALDAEPLSAPRLVGLSDWDCFLSVKAVVRVELRASPGSRPGRRSRHRPARGGVRRAGVASSRGRPR